MTSKKCIDCKIEYQLSERDLKRYEHQCPECRKKYYRKYCFEWRERVKARGEINHKWAANPQNKQKIKVYNKTRLLYRKGQIIYSPCVTCGNKDTQKHHPDYSRADLVIWLCSRCHWMIHHNLEYFIEKEKSNESNAGTDKRIK